MLCIKPSAFILNVIIQSVIMLISISLIVIMLNVFMVIVIVMAPSIGFNQNILFISFSLTLEAI
jgi:hypothetical protein